MEIKDAHIELFQEVYDKYPRPRVSQIYKVDEIAKAYLGFPAWFPMAYVALLEHGVALQHDIFRGKLLSSKDELILVDTQSRKDLLQAQGKEAYVLGPLFVHARKLYNIEAKPDRKGTLVFPIHASHTNTVHFDWEKYAESLLALPEEYHPFTACIYWMDVMKGRHRAFEKYGIKVITNGHIHDPKFVYNCLHSISQHRYCTGNELVSSMFYSIEMGIPFFLFGNDQGLVSELEDYRAVVDRHPKVKELKQIFTKTKAALETPLTISPAAQEIVDFYLDKPSWMPPDELRRMIWRRTPELLFKKALSILKLR